MFGRVWPAYGGLHRDYVRCGGGVGGCVTMHKHAFIWSQFDGGLLFLFGLGFGFLSLYSVILFPWFGRVLLLY